MTLLLGLVILLLRLQVPHSLHLQETLVLIIVLFVQLLFPIRLVCQIPINRLDTVHRNFNHDQHQLINLHSNLEFQWVSTNHFQKPSHLHSPLTQAPRAPLNPQLAEILGCVRLLCYPNIHMHQLKSLHKQTTMILNRKNSLLQSFHRCLEYNQTQSQIQTSTYQTRAIECKGCLSFMNLVLLLDCMDSKVKSFLFDFSLQSYDLVIRFFDLIWLGCRGLLTQLKLLSEVIFLSKCMTELFSKNLAWPLPLVQHN